MKSQNSIKESFYCSICKTRQLANNCPSCDKKACSNCFIQCRNCNILKCKVCCTLMKNCHKGCNNILCNTCIISLENQEIIFNSYFYKGNICKELRCKNCEEMNCCKICRDSCCFKCLKFCSFCYQIICKNCHENYNKNKDKISYKSISCKHNINILLGCNKGKILNYNLVEKKIILEHNLHKTKLNNHITSLVKINEMYATSSDDGYIKVWKDQSFEKIFIEYDNEGFRVSQCVMISDDKIAASGWENKKGIVLNLDFDDQENIVTSINVDSQITSICKYNYSTVLLGGYEKPFIYFWNINKNKIIYQFKPHEHCVNNIIKLKQGTYVDGLVTTGEDREVKIWDNAGRKIRSISNIDLVQNYTCLIKENLDGRIIVSTMDYIIKLYDLRSNNNTILKYHNGFVYDYLVLDEYNLISCSKDSFICHWDLRKSTIIDTIKLESVYPVRIVNPYS